MMRLFPICVERRLKTTPPNVYCARKTTRLWEINGRRSLGVATEAGPSSDTVALQDGSVTLG